MQDVHDALGPVPEYNLASRWSGGQGNPRTITWSLVPDGLNIPSAASWDNNGNSANSDLFNRMDNLFGNRALWIQRIQESFDRWEEITGIDYVRVTSGGNEWDDGASWGSSGSGSRGDVRIAMRNIDGPSGILAWNNYPGGGTGGNMVVDRSELWNSAANENRFLRDVLMHEMGHGIGIQHICSANSSQLMEPSVNTIFDGPRQDDIRGAQRHYGDPYEPNNNAGAATYIGQLDESLSFGELPLPQTGSNDVGAALLSIDANGESDYYRFSISSPSIISVSLIPVGNGYQDENQQGGSCPGGSSNQVEALTIGNLNVRVYDTNGTTILGESAENGAGIAEVLNNVELTTAGDYFVRIYEQGSQSQAQLYRFTMSAAPYFSSFCDASDGSLVSCPCGNQGTPDSGCDISQGTGGAELHVVYQEVSPQNRATLLGAGFPVSTTPTAVVIRSSALEPSPIVFGDGLRCVGVPLVRLAATSAFIGFSNHTLGHGSGAGSGQFYYQLWFRNTPAMFCTPDAFNLSNGRTLDW
jgi:hypothetical protein